MSKCETRERDRIESKERQLTCLQEMKIELEID